LIAFLGGLVGGFFLSTKENFRAKLLKLYAESISEIRKTSETNGKSHARVTDNRRHLMATFEDCGKVYETYIPYNRKLARKTIIITGATSGKVYPFHSALLPGIKARDFNEEKWLVKIDDGETEIFETLENFSC
jgi:hypothetical protein